MDLSLSTETMGDRTIVRVGGEIDVYTAPKLREQLVELVNDGSFHLVVDMEGVDFLDSTGLGVLVGGLKRVRAHEGSLRLVCNQERILKIPYHRPHQGVPDSHLGRGSGCGHRLTPVPGRVPGPAVVRQK